MIRVVSEIRHFLFKSKDGDAFPLYVLHWYGVWCLLWGPQLTVSCLGYFWNGLVRHGHT